MEQSTTEWTTNMLLKAVAVAHLYEPWKQQRWAALSNLEETWMLKLF